MILLVVPVRVHYCHQHLLKLSLVITVELSEDGFEVLCCKGVKELGHRRPLLLVDPLFLERRKQQLVELTH